MKKLIHILAAGALLACATAHAWPRNRYAKCRTTAGPLGNIRWSCSSTHSHSVAKRFGPYRNVVAQF